MIKLVKYPFYFVFDVESVGLYGDGFAVGITVLDSQFKRLEWADALFYCDYKNVRNWSEEGRQWLASNLPTDLLQDFNCFDCHEVREKFWKSWLEWKNNGAVAVVDCGYPVETTFLHDCIDHSTDKNRWGEAPYPLIDLSTLLFSAGFDPLREFSRLEDELPKHNPLKDSRQSARVFIETMLYLEKALKY